MPHNAALRVSWITDRSNGLYTNCNSLPLAGSQEHTEIAKQMSKELTVRPKQLTGALRASWWELDANHLALDR